MSNGEGMTALAVAGATLALVGGIYYVARYEPAEDAARKPEVIARIIDGSHKICNLTEDYPGGSYDARFREALSDVKTSALDLLIENNIQVCLDSRLNEQDTGIFDYKIAGIYYPGERILTVFDRASSYGSFGATQSFYGRGVIEDFQGELGEQGVSLTEIAIAAYVGGKGAHVDFKAPAKFEDTLRRNPQLRHIP